MNIVDRVNNKVASYLNDEGYNWYIVNANDEIISGPYSDKNTTEYVNNTEYNGRHYCSLIKDSNEQED
jgi:hypothetical protein